MGEPLALDRDERPNLPVTRIQALESPEDSMEAIEGIKRGLESMKRGGGKPARKFFREFFAAEGIHGHD